MHIREILIKTSQILTGFERKIEESQKISATSNQKQQISAKISEEKMFCVPKFKNRLKYQIRVHNLQKIHES